MVVVGAPIGVWVDIGLGHPALDAGGMLSSTYTFEDDDAFMIAKLALDIDSWGFAALDLRFRCLNPDAGPAADWAAPRDIVEQCHRAARDGAWGLVREAEVGERQAALDVLDALRPSDLSPAVLAALAAL